MVEADEYLADVRARLSPSTYDGYEFAVRKVLLPFMETRGIAHPGDLKPTDLAALAVELGTRVKSDASRKTYLRQVNVFLGWLGKHGTPTPKAPLPRLRRKHRDVLSRQEMRALEAAAPLERDRLIIRLACDFGPRLGELAAMTIDDVRARGRKHDVVFRGKTGERTVGIPEGLYGRLRDHIAHRPRRTSSRALWLSERSYAGLYEPLAEKGIYLRIKYAARRSGLEARIHPHALRHSAITLMVASHMFPGTIAAIAGVSVEVIASNYSHLTDDDRYDAVMRFLNE